MHSLKPIKTWVVKARIVKKVELIKVQTKIQKHGSLLGRDIKGNF